MCENIFEACENFHNSLILQLESIWTYPGGILICIGGGWKLDKPQQYDPPCASICSTGKENIGKLPGILSEVTVIYDKFCFYLCLFINGKWTTRRSLLFDSFELVCIMVTPPIHKSTLLVRFSNFAYLVYRVYMLFQFNHRGPIA